MKKRILSIILSIVMLVSLLPTTALAADQSEFILATPATVSKTASAEDDYVYIKSLWHVDDAVINSVSNSNIKDSYIKLQYSGLVVSGTTLTPELNGSLNFHEVKLVGDEVRCFLLPDTLKNLNAEAYVFVKIPAAITPSIMTGGLVSSIGSARSYGLSGTFYVSDTHYNQNGASLGKLKLGQKKDGYEFSGILEWGGKEFLARYSISSAEAHVDEFDTQLPAAGNTAQITLSATAMTDLGTDAGAFQTPATITKAEVLVNGSPAEGVSVSSEGENVIVTLNENVYNTIRSDANATVDVQLFVTMPGRSDGVWTNTVTTTLVAPEPVQAKWGASAESLTGEGTLQAAFNAAAGNSGSAYIQLQSGVTMGEDETLTVSGGTFTLDLNGQTVSGAKSEFFTITGGNVTIDDTGANQSGKISSTNIRTVYISGGTLNLKGGRLESISAERAANAVFITGTGSASVEISGGEVYAESTNTNSPYPSAVYINSANSSLTVSGGSITAKGPNVESSHPSGIEVKKANTLNVKGGEISAVVDGKASNSWASGIQVISAAAIGTFTVSGGSISAGGGDRTGGIAFYEDQALTISGGSITLSNAGSIAGAVYTFNCAPAITVVDSAAFSAADDFTDFFIYGSSGMKVKLTGQASAPTAPYIINTSSSSALGKDFTDGWLSLNIPDGDIEEYFTTPSSVNKKVVKNAESGELQLVAAYTVKFDAYPAEDPASQKLLAGEKVTKPADPVREGYRLTHWCTAYNCKNGADCTNAWNFDTPVTAGETLYAAWERTHYIVTFDAQNGTENTKQLVSVSGGTVLEPAVPTKQGHTFSHWCTRSWCSNYTDCDKWDFAEQINDDEELYAIWQEFVSISGTVSISGSAQYGETLTANYTGSEDVTYQWYRGDDAISGETGSTYTLTAADIGCTIRVVVTGTGDYSGTKEAVLNTEVEKADGSAAPAGLAATKPSEHGVSDGKITGVDTTMEYSADGSNWTACTGDEIANLSAGTYYVRVAETATHKAGAAATTTVPEGDAKYTIAVEAAPAIGGTVSGGGIYVVGNSVTVTAVPNDGYHFVNWTENGSVVEDADADYTFTAACDRALTANFAKNSYTVTWSVDGRTTTQQYEHGATPSFQGSTAKASDAQYSYTFKGWTPEITAVTGEVTYTATYTETVNKYTVKFVNEGGAVLQSSEVAYGETPAYTGETPTKAADTQYTYTFAGWTPEITAVTGEVTYTATYNSTVNKYTVKFVNEGGAVLQSSEVAYGETPVYSGETPTKAADAQYSYTFKGWTPEITAVTGDVTYTATYTETVNKYTVTFYDEDGTTVLESKEWEYGQAPVYNDGNNPTKQATAEKTYTFAGWSPTIATVTGTAFYTASFTDATNSYNVTWYDEDGTTVLGTASWPYGSTPGFTGSTPTKAADSQYTYTFERWIPVSGVDTDGKITGTASYKAVYDNTVNTYTVAWKNGDTVLETDVNVPYGTTPGYDGDTPAKAATAQYTYSFKGWDKEIEAVTGDITYTAQFDSTVNRYTVTFDAANGDALTSVEVNYGDKVAAPADPTKEGYIFAGWYTAPDGGEQFDFNQEITGNITLYAHWSSEPVYDITGKVEQAQQSGDPTPAEGVTVTLRQGNTVLFTKITDVNGLYDFHAPAGSYNIVAETEDGKTMTQLVTVTDHNERVGKIILPYQNVSSELTVIPGTPDIVVGGLDEEVVESNPNATANETHITLSMTVEQKEDVTSSETPEDAELKAEQEEIKTEAGSQKNNLTFLKIDLTKVITGTGAGSEPVTTTTKPLKIIIPFETSGRQNFKVYRYHGSDVEVLTTTANADGEFIEIVGDSIIIHAKKFSTYAIGYTVPASSGGYTPTYAITVERSENGEVKANRSYASSGTTVTITVTTEDGYVLKELSVTDSQDNKIEVTDKGNGTYTFKMPRRKVTVEASFVAAGSFSVCPKDDTCPIWPFTDAETTAWYHDGVHYCIENGLMAGYGDGIFKPNADTTRAMITVMLWRLNGSPVVNYLLDFEDVEEGKWYTEAIRWAKSEGIAAGYGNGYFGTNDAVTREQMVTILWRYAQYKGIDVSVGEDTNILSYNDAFNVAEYAIPAMQWACGSGMVQGMNAPDGKGMILAPESKGTRAQIATMMMRFCTEIVQK